MALLQEQRPIERRQDTLPDPVNASARLLQAFHEAITGRGALGAGDRPERNEYWNDQCDRVMIRSSRFQSVQAL